MVPHTLLESTDINLRFDKYDISSGSVPLRLLNSLPITHRDKETDRQTDRQTDTAAVAAKFSVRVVRYIGKSLDFIEI